MANQNSQNQQNQGASKNPSGGMQNPGSTWSGSTFATGLIVGLIVGWGLTFLWARHHDNGMMAMMNGTDTSSMSGTETTSTPNYLSPTMASSSEASSVPMTVAAGTLSVQTGPQSAGHTAFISYASLNQTATWIAIQDDVNGKPGRILGAALFASDMTTGVIHLLRPTLSGHTYFAVLYSNGGGIGHQVFNLKTDLPITDSNGNLITSTFTAR